MTPTVTLTAKAFAHELAERLHRYQSAKATHDALGGPSQRLEFEHSTLREARDSVGATVSRVAAFSRREGLNDLHASARITLDRWAKDRDCATAHDLARRLKACALQPA